ncbi:threonine/serine dehydratase [Lachnospiraceae bacterium NSJ-143]|nr:threonine/serine dehydratase [Lachnospiraceae bacterium NSJ-143]
MQKDSLTIDDIKQAQERISPYINRTKLIRAESMDNILNCKVYLKPEMLQKTGAFKLRGALNTVFLLDEESRKKGIITSSSGNHGQACAYIGKMLGIPVTVVLPNDTPKIKIERTKNHGANIILEERSYEKRWIRVQEEVDKYGCSIVHPYENFNVMAGQGTIGLELLEDLPYLDKVVVPVGGGGLISGISTAIKEINPKIQVIGVEPEAADPYIESRKQHKRVSVGNTPTIADGLSTRQAGNNTYPIIEKYVDEIVSVDDDSIKQAVKLVASEAKLIAEPSSCVGIAAVLSGKLKVSKEENIAFVLTAGNWDIDKIGKILNDEEIEATS